MAIYNDTSWIVYDPNNSPLPSITISSFSLDSSKNLWICTAGGLAVHNPNGIIGIKNKNIYEPSGFKLNQNFPNPFNPITTIEFEIPKTSWVKISVYDINGRFLENFVNSLQYPGIHKTIWNALRYSSNVYFYILEGPSIRISKKMILIK